MKFKHFGYLIIFFCLVVIALPNFASAISITIGIPEKFSEVKAGEKVYFETEVKWPENDGRKDLRIEYSIIDKDGKEVAYLKVLKAIETQASFMDSISIPESTARGMYKINVKISDYKDLEQEVAASFNVAKRGNNVLTYLFIIIGILGVISIIVIIDLVVLVKKNHRA